MDIDVVAIRRVLNYNAQDLAKVFHESGYTGTTFRTAECAGMNADGDFVFDVSYYNDAWSGDEDDEENPEILYDKAYVYYNHTSKKFLAEF